MSIEIEKQRKTDNLHFFFNFAVETGTELQLSNGDTFKAAGADCLNNYRLVYTTFEAGVDWVDDADGAEYYPPTKELLGEIIYSGSYWAKKLWQNLSKTEKQIQNWQGTEQELSEFDVESALMAGLQ
jgi:hypothetical protein